MTVRESSRLLPVSLVAEAVLGRRVSTRTVLRWAISGRSGRRLPTVLGIRRQHCCTEETFRRWLAESSGQGIAQPQAENRDAAADAALAAMGIGGR